MRLLHDLARTHASFDDPNLVSRAGLVPVMALAQRAGLGGLVAEHVRPGGECGVNAYLKIPCLIAGMVAYGLLGWLLATVTHTPVLLPLGTIAGLVVAIAGIAYKYGRA